MADERRTLRVLIAEDSAVVAGRLRALLDGAGGVRVVGVASCGAEALRLFAAETPDAVVIDLHMPAPNGLDAVRAIRASGHSCVVLVVSSSSEESLRAASLAAGADEFVEKVRMLDELLPLLRARAASRSAPLPA